MRFFMLSHDVHLVPIGRNSGDGQEDVDQQKEEASMSKIGFFRQKFRTNVIWTNQLWPKKGSDMVRKDSDNCKRHSSYIQRV